MAVRLFKQIFYGSIFLIIIIGLLAFFYFSFKSKPSCFDGKQNQGEEGIDCGGPCSQICLPADFRNIEVTWTKLLNTKSQLILIAKIQNPNSGLASYSFDYEFNILSNGEVLKTIQGKSFIYAEEIKYIEEFVNKDNMNADNLEIKFAIKNVNWVKSQNFSKPKIDLISKDIQLKDDFNYLTGRIKNSDFVSLNNVQILANVYDNKSLISSSKTLIDNIFPAETKNFQIIFPKDIDISKYNLEIVIETKKQ
jgi:hypothetical protein